MPASFSRFIVAAALATLAPALPAGAQDRLALLIGNEDYPSVVGRLSLPHEDVAVLEESLEAIGFSVVTVLDADEDEMEEAIAAFASRLDRAGPEAAGFFYYAGHGASTSISGRRRNFLLPARERISNATELRIHGVRLDEIVDALAATQARAVFVVADACRNSLTWSENMGPDRGFGVETARGGVIVAQSTAEGETAPDDGAFARALAMNMRAPGRYSSRMFELAYREVARTRDHYRVPTTQGALTDDFCFVSCPADLASPGVSEVASLATVAQRLVFDAAEAPCEYAMFVRDFPDSPLVGIASRRAASSPPCDAPATATPSPDPSAGLNEIVVEPPSSTANAEVFDTPEAEFAAAVENGFETLGSGTPDPERRDRESRFRRDRNMQAAYAAQALDQCSAEMTELELLHSIARQNDRQLTSLVEGVDENSLAFAQIDEAIATAVQSLVSESGSMSGDNDAASPDQGSSIDRIVDDQGGLLREYQSSLQCIEAARLINSELRVYIAQQENRIMDAETQGQ